MSRTEVTEFCPHCENEITMVWDTADLGFQAICPVCGKRLMLCDECQHTVCEDGEPHCCDYDSTTDRCHRQKASPAADIVPADPVEIRTVAYQRYQMWWCLNHNITVADILAKYSEYWGEVEADSEDTGFDTFLAETGFGGEMWACMDEFLDSEYQDVGLMAQILDMRSNPELYVKYLHDRISCNH